MNLTRTVICLSTACAALAASDVHAAAYYVQARTEAQAYQMRAYWGTDPNDVVLLPRRRIVQYLNLGAFELVTGSDFGFESSLRVSIDFGVTPEQAEMIDGLRAQDADLMYAHARYRTGGFEGMLGRQYLIDSDDIFAFDGLRARYVHPKLGLGAEAFAGLWVKGASLLGSSTYQLDGIREQEQNPSARLLEYDPFLEEQRALEPVFGARLLGETVAGLGVSAGLGYRQSMAAGNITSQRLGAELRYGNRRGNNALSSLDYDLYAERISTFRLQARYDGANYAATVEALRFSPSFSSYSLWYYFATSPRDELRLRGDWAPGGPLRYYAMVLVDHYNTTIPETAGLFTAVQEDRLGPSNALGASAGARYTRQSVRSSLDLTWRNGYGGRQFWLDYTAGYSGAERKWSLDGRLSIASIRDAQNPLLRGMFYGAQLWGSYQLTRAARASLVLEEDINPFTRSDTKVFFVFDLKAVL